MEVAMTKMDRVLGYGVVGMLGSGVIFATALTVYELIEFFYQRSRLAKASTSNAYRFDDGAEVCFGMRRVSLPR
jgi:hypothetical protein